MNEVKGRQEVASGLKGMGDKHTGVKRADKNTNSNGKEAQRNDDLNTRSDNGEGTTGITKEDSETKKRLRKGSLNACGFATEERKMIEIVVQVSTHDLDMVGIQQS